MITGPDEPLPSRLSDGPLDHLARPALPWRDGQPLTECGRRVEGLPLITREELVARVRNLGSKRASFSTCITCWETASRWKPWDEDPVQAMGRECGPWYRNTAMLRDELLALAELVRAHPQEFRAILNGLAEAPRLDEARAARRLRREQGY